MKSESFVVYATSQNAKLDATMNRKPSCIAHLDPILLMLGSVNLLEISSPAVDDTMMMPIS